MKRGGRLPIRAEDAVWLVLFSALGVLSPERSWVELVLLALLAAMQVLEPKVAALERPRRNAALIGAKLLAGYLLIGYTGGITSSYYLILLVPVVSAATTRGPLGTALFTALACGSYLSFLLFIDWNRYVIPPDQVRELSLRVVFLAVVAYLTYRLAEANRVEARKYQAATEQLAAANRNLQVAEAAVRRSERLAALGQLSAGLAHELRNPLGTIRASAEMLQKSLPEHHGVAHELAGFIAAEVDRANSLVSRFLEFARPLELQAAEADLGEVIDRAVARVAPLAAANDVTVHKNYSPDIGPFRFDEELVERLVYNLVLNAVEASAPGAAVTVKTRPVDDSVEIAVIDRGCGIEPQHLENIFNPFFTTKPDGVGLGLAIVSKIVDEHGGKMAVESEPGKGSAFRVYLPRRRSHAQP
ncbi:MAG: ATP-binding protein [Bryobacterales bacterium]|nr:ATP-binding protein [Bryobacteraceae bacterium]MDW8354703.1 ATP-binding protein [Bryobacterales bacterium]